MALQLDQIKLTNYKSYTLAAYDWHPKLNAILGLNGVGKTNLLDAIYYSCLGKSYFSSGDRRVAKKKSSFFRIESLYRKNRNQERFVAKVQPGKKKEISVDGKRIERIGDHIGRYPCIIIAPLDIQLLLEGSEERRKFMNASLIQYDATYIQELITYNKALKQRNALLKSFTEKRYYDSVLLDSISKNMLQPASYIYSKRQELVAEISDLFSDIYARISGYREDCKVLYKSALKKNSMENILHDHKEKDRILGRTSQGIHRDDLVFMMNGSPIKPFGSQGQLKSFVIALKLSQYHQMIKHNNTKPILLLDDIFDKLDQQRVSHLLSILHEDVYGQVFITDKDEKTIVTLLGQISSDYRIFVINENTSQHSEEE